VVQGVEERHRSHEVGREPGQQQAALLQRLLDEREVEHLQVAQAAVDQLRRARRRARGEVALLDQAHLEPTRDGVERRSDPDDAAADHEDVELALGELLEGVSPLVCVEGLGEGHAPSVAGVRVSAGRRPRCAGTP
jgi:hypothetical protein